MAEGRPARVALDGNEAAASVAYRLSEVIAIYPITPSSAMGEHADAWSAAGKTNVYGAVPSVVEMQSEGGAAGAVHGAVQGGALATSFTASQGLLLMLPNMFKLAGELSPFVLHVAARTIATHALSIFGDHSDVMAARTTGFALLASANVQEAHDLALVAHAATLRSRVPFLHFFDGFRTSHEVATIEPLSDDDLRALVDERLVAEHRARALDPDAPVVRGTAQNPDTFFQAREAANGFHAACPGIVQDCLDALARRVGRRYGLVEWTGHPEAERAVVVMGSAAETARETVRFLAARGERVGVLQVRLYRPFPLEALVAALPPTVRAVGVLDRTKEPGAPGEPLWLDVAAALRTRPDVSVVGGRYGLSSKELTPGMVAGVFAELARAQPRHGFTVGIVDDVTHTSLAWEPLEIEPDAVSKAVFFGLGADGTVSANKASIKIVAEETGLHAQGYFVYDSKKSGAVTVSHLRVSPEPIHAPWLIARAGFVACHQWGLLDRLDVVGVAAPRGVLLLNAPYPRDAVWDALSRETQEAIVEKGLRLHAIDALAVARAQGLGGRINTIMQTCWFALSGFLARDEAVARIKESIARTYRAKGEAVVQRNYAAVDATLANLFEVPVPAAATSARRRLPAVAPGAPELVRRVTAVMLEGKGDLLPVSAFPPDGTWPTGTARWEKRSLAHEIPAWDEVLCIQCNKCAFVCPHAAIRAAVYPPAALERAPAGFLSADFRGREHSGMKYTIQVAPDDCTGCNLCIQVCPAKDKSNPRHKALDPVAKATILEAERRSFEFFLDLPPVDRRTVTPDVKGSQFLEPLLEFSGACAGCGETPYLKLLTQHLGDRLVIANATGCSSIYGANLPTTPYARNRDGRGPAWSNSLFEDNAEFGLGLRLASDHRHELARALVRELAPALGDDLAKGLLEGGGRDEAAVHEQRLRIAGLEARLPSIEGPAARRLATLAKDLVRRSVWLVGGDGWAYDIGFGGLDHVLALGRDVKVLVLDTEVYSNTGGQQSKATPLGAAAKFAVSGKALPKKDLGLMAMTYGSIYVARIAFGAKDVQTEKVLREAEAFPGPALVIAYSPCIAHGYDLAFQAEQQKLAVGSGYWPLYRFDPRRIAAGESPLQLDSPSPRSRVQDFTRNELRFRMVEQDDPARWKTLLAAAEADARLRLTIYEQLARAHVAPGAGAEAKGKD